MKALVTGFEPFGGDGTNPSLEVARRLPRAVGRFSIASGSLPVAFGRALGVLGDLVRSERPDVVICLGLASGRRDLGVETTARNLKDARIPDNDGAQPRGEPIDPRAPAFLSTGLPLEATLAALRGAGVPASASPSAGTYLCNYVFYGLVRHVLREEPSLRAGFIHIPASPELAAARPGVPFLPLESTAAGVRAVLELLSR